MKVSILFLLFPLYLFGQHYPGQPTTVETALQLQAALSADQQVRFIRSFADPRRTTWDRIPKVREGLKMSLMNQDQKQILHALLQRCMSKQGYLLATSIMFNEDIQKKFEPDLGRNEYWIELFGDPGADNFWGWQLEGHHLSLNFTFFGEKMISNTPFLIGANPQIVDSDEARNGLNFIYDEERMAGAIVNAFTPEQRKVGYSDEDQPNNVYGEIYRDALKSPDDGIAVTKLFRDQSNWLDALLSSYQSYFLPTGINLADRDLNGETYFFFMGDTAPNGRHYYRIKNQHLLIECENYGNHTHHLWRSTNDFGVAFLK